MDASAMLFEHAQGGFSVLSFHHLKTCIAEHLGNDKADQLFIFSDEDQDLVRHVFSLHSGPENGQQGFRFPFQRL
jgi:hypothetical protein